MPPKRRLIHKSIIFTVEPAHISGLYSVRFEMAGKEIQGHVKTRLLGIAIKRAKSAIDRKLREQRARRPS
jgi:hypothetical protein